MFWIIQWYLTNCPDLMLVVNNSVVKFGMLLIMINLTSRELKDPNKFSFSTSFKIDQALIVSLEG
jgi:hypothetical protein